jgi:hypothetical protein
MARVWYCRTCGYEVKSRGKCHSCGAKLTASELPELVSGPDDEEVGYELDGWTDRDRGRLIHRLNTMGIEHRFEGEELVIEASDEERVDDLVAALGEGASIYEPDEVDGDDDEEPEDDESDWVARAGLGSTAAEAADLEDGHELVDGTGDPATGESVALLIAAARRLSEDPTDMQADADVAEASARVFMVDSFGPLDVEEWSAVGRVTRLLLSLLGADEALEDDIRLQASILGVLLAPIGQEGGGASDTSPGHEGEWTVYELTGWRPEQRAELSVLLSQRGVPHSWEGDELLVAEDRESDTEELFDSVGGGGGEDDDESDEVRYGAVAELFAATGRLAGDPSDRGRRDAVLEWVHAVEGPPLLGMDEVVWFRIRSRARNLAESIGAGGTSRISDEANDLHDLLRSVV